MILEVLTEEVRLGVHKNDDLILALAKLNNVRVSSVVRWLTKNDESLTKAKNLSLIREYLGLPDDAVLTEQKELEEA